MALFEIEDGHLFPAQFGRPVANGLTPDVLDSVRDQILEIVSRPLFPITWRDMSRVADPSNSQPRLTALDASGQIVSVEVVAHLDSETLIASLSRLADTAALSWMDLAREYPGDVEGFKAGWVHFRDSMPPSPAPGPRLIMVVGSIDLQVRPALEVLASSGVEVHEMSLRQMSNGRSFLEVHAVGPRLYGHIPQVLLDRTGTIPELESLRDPGAGATAGARTEEAPMTGGPARLAAEAMDRPRHVREDLEAPAETAPVLPSNVDHAAEARAESWAEVQSELLEESRAGWARAASADASSGSDDVPEWNDVVDGAQRAEEAAAYSSVDRDAEGGDGTPHANGPAAQDIPLLVRDTAGMEALGQIVGEDVPLVLAASVTPQLVGTLTASGRVAVAGRSFADPTAALVANGVSELNGWTEWHLGDVHGPTLAESLEEVNAEILREYSRTGAATRTASGPDVPGRAAHSHQR